MPPGASARRGAPGVNFGGQCPQPISHAGVPPVAISHGNLLRFVTSLTRPVSLLRCSRCIDQSPPCQRGVVWRSQTGGIKGWQISTWVCSFEKAPTVNPSVTPPACQLPLAREPLGLPDSRKTGFAGTLNDLTIENRMRSPVQIVRRTKKAPIPNGIEAFLELLARFELATSSLPRMRSTD